MPSANWINVAQLADFETTDRKVVSAGDRPVLAYAPGNTSQRVFLVQLDAWSAALRLHRVTINGYSGGMPASHERFFWRPTAENARQLLAAWAIPAGDVSLVETLDRPSGPVPATGKLLTRLNLTLDRFDAIELNEAFAAQGVAVLRGLGLADDDARVNPNGGAIALGHPLGMSGARLLMTLVHQLERSGGGLGLATLCIGVGQGLAMAVERI